MKGNSGFKRPREAKRLHSMPHRTACGSGECAKQLSAILALCPHETACGWLCSSLQRMLHGHQSALEATALPPFPFCVGGGCGSPSVSMSPSELAYGKDNWEGSGGEAKELPQRWCNLLPAFAAVTLLCQHKASAAPSPISHYSQTNKNSLGIEGSSTPKAVIDRHPQVVINAHWCI